MKILVAMSGGVDSSAAAFLLKMQGHECIGVNMKLHNLNTDGNCGSSTDALDAQRAAQRIGIPFHICDYSEDFRHEVIDRFICAYNLGMTPNPCVDCNRHMKFGKLYDYAKLLGCDAIATGHYARVEYSKEYGRYVIKKATDETKDQSYVLYSLMQNQLSHTIFPLGSMTKDEVRRLLEKNGFENAHKHDSQDICFVPDGDYVSVIEKLTEKSPEPGYFIDCTGKRIGKHKGLIHYTIGQRKGLGISCDKPLYVTKLDYKENTVTLGSDEELYYDRFRVGNINSVAFEKIEGELRASVKIRYRQSAQPARIIAINDNEAEVVFDSPVRAITPGQSTVFYRDDILLGGGVILPQ